MGVWAALRRSHGLRIGVPLDTTQVASSIERYFGNAPVEFVPLATGEAFFEGDMPISTAT